MNDSEILERMVKQFFYYDGYNKGLAWSFNEGFTVGNFDKELEDELIKRFVVNNEVVK